MDLPPELDADKQTDSEMLMILTTVGGYDRRHAERIVDELRHHG